MNEPADTAMAGGSDRVTRGTVARGADLIATEPFNLGRADDYRVPDHGYHRRLPDDIWVDSAAVVVEVVSPDDEAYATFGFYAAHA